MEGNTATPVGADRADVRAAASSALTPDPATAQLLEKFNAGEKLSAQEYGKVGAWASLKRRLEGVFHGKGQQNGGPSKSGPATGNAPALAAVATAQGPGDTLDAEPVDAGLVQRTTGAVLTRCESIARRIVSNAAREADAPPEMVARFDRAASLPKDDRALMVELSPDVAAAFGLNPRHYPIGIFLGTFGLWATDIWMAVQELKAMKEKKATTQGGEDKKDGLTGQ